MDEVVDAAARFSTQLKYPRVFQEFVERHAFVAFEVGGIRVYGNVQGEEDSLEDLMEDKILTRDLVNAGFLPFGRPSTGSYDRVCFDTRATHRPMHDAPVVLMDHESILSKNRIPKPKWIADGLIDLVQRANLKTEPGASLEPPRRVSASDVVVTPTLDCPQKPGFGGGR